MGGIMSDMDSSFSSQEITPDENSFPFRNEAFQNGYKSGLVAAMKLATQVSSEGGGITALLLRLSDRMRENEKSISS